MSKSDDSVLTCCNNETGSEIRESEEPESENEVNIKISKLEMEIDYLKRLMEEMSDKNKMLLLNNSLLLDRLRQSQGHIGDKITASNCSNYASPTPPIARNLSVSPQPSGSGTQGRSTRRKQYRAQNSREQQNLILQVSSLSMTSNKNGRTSTSKVGTEKKTKIIIMIKLSNRKL
ncbi:hypothetical protein HHI36_004523 [Cryptolaemus montrouzieri]|uniref:Uncharacterized protein n=1 Tax=Cryptolaemus montrouzieri TaxID=559131 RepID=A0ABD2NS39_9CUCU